MICIKPCQPKNDFDNFKTQERTKRVAPRRNNRKYRNQDNAKSIENDTNNESSENKTQESN